MLLPKNIRRLFLAVEAPNEAIEFINLNKVIIPNQKKFKWMRLHNLHLTIYFIGNTLKENYDEIFQISKNTISRYSYFTLYPENICLMPTSNPRMIWIKYHIHPAFTELNHALHHVLKKFLLKTHPIYPNPLPHITLARFYGFKKEININEFKNVLLQPLTVKEIRMWETMPSESKSDYSVSEKPFFLRNN